MTRRHKRRPGNSPGSKPRRKQPERSGRSSRIASIVSSRRFHIASLLLLVAASAAFYLSRDKLPAANQVDPAKISAPSSGTSSEAPENEHVDLQRALQGIEEQGLGEVEWSHPEGATDEYPKNPVIVVGQIHPDFYGKIKEERIPYFHSAYMVLKALVDNGIVHFAWENTSDPDSKITTNSTFPSADELLDLSTFDAVVKDLQELGYTDPLLTVLLSNHTYLTIDDTESAATKRKIQQFVQEFVPLDELFEQIHELMLESGGRIRLVSSDDDSIVIKIHNTEYEARELRRKLQRYLELKEFSSASGELNRIREEFLVQNVQADCIGIGHTHLDNLRAFFPRQGRSVALVSPTGMSEISDRFSKNNRALIANVNNLIEALDAIILQNSNN